MTIGLTNRVAAISVAGILAMTTVMTSIPTAAASSTTTATHKRASTRQPKKKTPPKPKVPTPHIGQVAKDGDFAFTITKVQCGVTTLGTSPIDTVAPTGSQWCLVNMNVKNIKSGSQTYFVSNQYAFDGKNRKLKADGGSLIYVPNGGSDVAAQVNPGVIISVTVPFQLPTTSRIKKFELHDSAFSNGVTVWNVR